MFRISCFLILLFATATLHAHPVPKDNHDRHIQVTFRNGEVPLSIVVAVDFRLEVDEFTAVQQDMKPFRDEVDPSLFAKKPLEYYGHFAKIYAPIFADNLLATVDGRELKWQVLKKAPSLIDEKGEPLGHLRCDFRFEAEFTAPPKGGVFRLEDTNYRDQEGQIFLTFVNEASLQIRVKKIPELDLNLVHPLQRPRDYEERLRILEVAFRPTYLPTPEPAPQPKITAVESHPPQEEHDDFLSVYRWARENFGFWMVMLICTAVGAVHALTPGHGKTLVAAYLIGQRGTVWHAFLLGLVTTLTHTFVVWILAAVLWFLPEAMSAESRKSIQVGLGLVMGLSVVGLGFWLLLQRLAGRADHVHLGGGHDHHHGPAESDVNGWSLLVMGITGGIIPCWDAVILLAMVVGTGEFWIALPATLAFSLGLASVLVLIGILVVKFRGMAGSSFGEGPIVRALPVISAAMVMAIGMWLCYQAAGPLKGM